MKKTCIVLAKVLIWFLFLCNIGFIRFLLTPTPKTELERQIVKNIASADDRGRRDAKVFAFYMKRVDAAKVKVKNGGVYSPYDYFTDYKAVTDTALALGSAMAGSLFAELQQFMRESFSKGFTQEDLDKARDIAIPGSYAEGKRIKAESFPWFKIVKWFLSQYVKNFFLGFALLLLWLYQKKEVRKRAIRNPLSSIICIIFYPITIGYSIIKWWRSTGREVSASVEILRTRERLFSLFSKDEIALIKKFGYSSMSLKEFRGVLKLRGLTIRHAFIPALIALLIMQLIPAAGIGGIAAIVYDTRAEIQHVTRPKEFVSKHAPHAEDTKVRIQSMWWKFDHEPVCIEPTLKASKIIVLSRYVCRTCRGYLNGVEHVPLGGLFVFVRNSFNHSNTYINETNKNHDYQYSICW